MEKINKLKKEFIQLGLDGYFIPKNDEFFGEYINASKDYLQYISNFSGSLGYALIMKKKNFLFVDGRYTTQAKIQSGKFFNIINIPHKYPVDILKKNYSIGFDPQLHTQQFLKHFFKKANIKLIPINENLVNKIWNNNNDSTRKNYFYSLTKKETGQNFTDKIKENYKFLSKKNIDIQFITASENIAWLLNIRGHDSEYSPIPNSRLILDSKKNVYLFCNLKKINKKFINELKKIKILDINILDLFLDNIKDKKILIDQRTCSIYFENIFKKNNNIIEFDDPIYLMKSIKNKIEIMNMKKSHIYDGVALTKFLIWIKKNYKNKKITEIDAQNKLLSFRKMNKYFKTSSFPTISGTGPNSAVIHYKANKKTNRTLLDGDIYLVDSGGQYKFGTTDVTRTISLNNNNSKIKDIFTRVLKGHIGVSNFRLNNNTTGSMIDVVARKYLKEIKLDYPHGTGHGVGYYLNVHEGLQGISSNNKVKFREGMIVSNEPGYYKEGKFGIRIENMIVVEKKKTSYKFNNLTMVPIDKSLINKKLLKKKEISWINNYHSKIYKNLNKFMKKSELVDFKDYCSNI